MLPSAAWRGTRGAWGSLTKVNKKSKSAALTAIQPVRGESTLAESYYDEDQKSMQKTLRSIIDKDINPNVDEWERQGQYPAQQVFKKLGQAGLLGINKPVRSITNYW